MPDTQVKQLVVQLLIAHLDAAPAAHSHLTCTVVWTQTSRILQEGGFDHAPQQAITPTLLPQPPSRVLRVLCPGAG